MKELRAVTGLLGCAVMAGVAVAVAAAPVIAAVVDVINWAIR